MKTLIVILVTSLYLLPMVAKSSGDSTLEYTLNQLINDYSKINTTEFVIDPSVTGTASIEGINNNEIGPVLLSSILGVHGFSAIEKNGKVYVLPKDSAKELILSGGTIWGNG